MDIITKNKECFKRWGIGREALPLAEEITKASKNGGFWRTAENLKESLRSKG